MYNYTVTMEKLNYRGFGSFGSCGILVSFGISAVSALYKSFGVSHQTKQVSASNLNTGIFKRSLKGKKNDRNVIIASNEYSASIYASPKEFNMTFDAFIYMDKIPEGNSNDERQAFMEIFFVGKENFIHTEIGHINSDRKSTRLNSSHRSLSRMPSSA